VPGKCNVVPLFAHRQLYLMAGVHEMKTYKCVHEASCIAIAKEIKNKIHKTHKTTVKQRKNKMKTSQNAHNRMKNRKFNS